MTSPLPSSRQESIDYWRRRAEWFDALLCACGHANGRHPVMGAAEPGHCLDCECDRRHYVDDTAPLDYD